MFIVRIVERSIRMFVFSQKISDIKSFYLTDYATFIRIDNVEKAVGYYNEAIRLMPKNVYAYFGLAVAQVEMKMFREALESCNKAILIKPNWRSYMLQSVIYKLLEENPMSEKALNEALRYFDNNKGSLYSQLGRAYFSFGRYEIAEYYFKEFLKIYPNSKIMRKNLDRVHKAMKQAHTARG